MTKLRVNITQTEIDKGEKASAYYCPLALAASRVTGQKCSVVFSLEVGMMGPHLKLSRRANQFVTDFDRGRPVMPSTFVLSSFVL